MDTLPRDTEQLLHLGDPDEVELLGHPPSLVLTCDNTVVS
jgi:hypothetical protein